MHTIVSIIMQSVRPICAACVRKTRAGAWKCARTPETHTHTRTQRQMKLKIRECDVSRFCERFGVFFVFDYTALCLRSLFICVPVARHVVPHKVIFCCCCIIAIDTYFVCVIVPTNHKSICEPQSGVCVCVPRLLIAALNSGPILYICIYGFVWYCLGRASMVWSTCVRQNAVAERFSSSKWTSRLQLCCVLNIRRTSAMMTIIRSASGDAAVSCSAAMPGQASKLRFFFFARKRSQHPHGQTNRLTF